MKFQVKAGRFEFDKETKKAKASKDKGLIKVFHNEEQQTHFSWINTDKSIQEIDLIVFYNDAVFQPVQGKPNTFVLRFETDDDRYFFWIQEKVDHKNVVTEINKIINYIPDEEMVDESEPVAEKPSQPQKIIDENIEQKNKPSGGIADFIRNMQTNLQSQKKKNQQEQKLALTHLYDVIGGETLNQIISDLTEEQKMSLLEEMPEEQRQTKHVPTNIRSPQFLQALDVLSDAFNSENAISLFMQLGLDQKFLYSYYGVEAFLRALAEWGKKQNEKKEEK